MTKRIMQEFRMDEISAVDSPAQKGAKVRIMKRDDRSELGAVIAKYMDEKGAKSFEQVFVANEERRKQWEANEELWPLFSALQDSLCSIAGDDTLSREAKLTRIRESVDQFLGQVRAKWPDVEAELEKLFTDPAMSGKFASDPAGSNPDGGNEMSDLNKKVGELEGQIADLNKKLGDEQKARETAEAIAKLNDAEKAHYASLSDDKAKGEFLAKSADDRKAVLDAIEKAKGADETITVDGQTISKRAVGDGVFAVMKSQQAAIAKQADDLKKAEEAREMADLRKRADDQYKHVAGTTEEKAALLKALKGVDETVRKTAEAILEACEKMTAAGFQKLGHNNGQPSEASAAGQLDKLAKAHAAEHKVSYEAAYDAVIQKNAALYQQAEQEKGAAN